MPDQCPRCASDRLAVMYYDADGNSVGGHSQCTECGPRHAEPLPVDAALVRRKLLEKKAS